MRESDIFLPQQEKASVNQANPVMYPHRYEMQMAVQEFHKLCEPKINKLKDGYSTMMNLIF